MRTRTNAPIDSLSLSASRHSTISLKNLKVPEQDVPLSVVVAVDQIAARTVEARSATVNSVGIHSSEVPIFEFELLVYILDVLTKTL